MYIGTRVGNFQMTALNWILLFMFDTAIFFLFKIILNKTVYIFTSKNT